MSATRILPYLLLFVSSLQCRAVLHAQANQLILPNGHEEGVISVKFTKDGKKLISASLDQTIRVWDFASGALLKTIYTGDPKQWILSLSPDENYAVVSSSRSSIKVWNLRTGQALAVLNGHSSDINIARFSPDGKKILTASSDKTAIIWSMPEGKILFQLWGHKKAVTHAFFSPDGRLVATSSDDTTTRVWNAADGRFLFELPGRTGWVFNRVFSNDSKRILTSYLKSGYEWSTTDGKKVHEFSEEGSVIDIFYNSNCKKVLLRTYGPAACIIRDISSGVMETQLESGSIYYAPSFSPDDRMIRTLDLNKDIYLWDARSGKQLVLNKAHRRSVYDADFSPDSRYIASASADSTIIIRETRTGNLVHKLETKVESVFDYKVTYSGQKLVSTLSRKSCIWDLDVGQTVAELSERVSRFTAIDFSPDGKDIYMVSVGNTIQEYDQATGTLRSWKWMLRSDEQPPGPGQRRLAASYGPTLFSADRSEIITTLLGSGNSKNISFSPGRVLIWNRETGEHVYEYNNDKQIYCANQSQDKKRIAVGFKDSTVQLIDRETGNTIVTYDQNAYIRSVAISPDGNRIYVLASNGVTIWTVSPQKYFDLPGHTAYINSMEFDSDGSRILTASADQTARVWDAVTGRLLLTVGDTSGAIQKAVFSSNGNKIITQTATNLFVAWNTHNGQKLYSFYPGDKDHSFIQLPSGYYQSSPEYSKLLHYVTPDLKVLSFESLDVKYNRPDKVLEALGNTDTSLIRSYRRAWEKRIKKLGIDTTVFRVGFSVPECDFENRDMIEYEQLTDQLRLRIKGADNKYKLDRFNVWVNESPLFGQRGIRLRKKSNNLDTVIVILLSQGVNRIETSITNVNGTESYRMPLIVNYTPAVRQKETLRFIGIGIDQFANKRYNLQYSSKDIRDLAVKLKEKYKDDIIIDTLFNENVTISNVKSLKQKLQQTTVNDKVILSYSGHGLLSKEYDYYLSTFFVNFDRPEENGLPYEELENLLDSIPARRKLMLIDACHSGEVDKEEMVRITTAQDSLDRQGTKGGQPTYTGKTTLGMKNSFELMQSLFVNVGKSTGATIISAAAGTQFALERGDLENGVFTYSILEAMDKNPAMKISELKKIVGERVEKLTNGLQKPTSRNETIASDWNLW